MPSRRPAGRRRYHVRRPVIGNVCFLKFVFYEFASLEFFSEPVGEAASGEDGLSARSLRTDSFSMGSLFILSTIMPTRIRTIRAAVARIVMSAGG